jgi:hypothetical protein
MHLLILYRLRSLHPLSSRVYLCASSWPADQAVTEVQSPLKRTHFLALATNRSSVHGVLALISVSIYLLWPWVSCCGPGYLAVALQYRHGLATLQPITILVLRQRDPPPAIVPSAPFPCREHAGQRARASTLSSVASSQNLWQGRLWCDI